MAKKEVNEKIKPIILRDTESGVEYTLEFNRESIRFAESRGFKVEDVADYPMSKIPELWFYAFRMHHKNVSREKTDKMIFDKDTGFGGINDIPDGVVERLFQLYAEPFEATKTEDERKNSKLSVEL